MSIVFHPKDIPLRTLKTRFVTKRKWSVANPHPPAINVWWEDTDNEELHVPMGCYKRMCPKRPDGRDNYPYKFSDYTPINLEFTSDLLTAETDSSGRKRDQDVLIEEALKCLQKRHSVLIAAHTGFGKTATAIWLLCYLGLKVMLLCHNQEVKRQWKEEILRFTGGKAKVQLLEGKKKMDPSADVYLAGIIKASTFHPDDLVDIGVVIVDEAHMCTQKAFTETLLKFQPYYLIGLTATPDRSDGLNDLFRFYFGTSDKYIVRHEVKKFVVFKYKTNYTYPVTKYRSFNGKRFMNLVEMNTDLANIKKRWIEIAEIARYHPKEKIILMCDRKEMARNIYNYLLEQGDSAALFIDGIKKCDKTKRILVAGISKGGVGLNDPDLTMAIIAGDKVDPRQQEGRIRQTNCIIYKIVDNHPSCEKHWKPQEEWFHSRGASIYQISGADESDEILRAEEIRD